MALSRNPNKTRTIEKAWDREIKRRFKQLKDVVFAIPMSGIVTNITAEQQAEINAFIAQMQETAIGILMSTNWQNEFQTEAYERALERADAELRAILTAQEAAAIGTLNMDATVLITTAIHSAELEFLHDRANTKLGKWVDDLLFDTRSILHEQLGIVSVDDIHAAIADRINITTSRAQTIAVTEIAQASQRAVVKEVEAINSQSDELLEVRWITVLDSRVRHLHAGWHGKIMSNEQASRNITISPWRCRCGLKPVVREKQSEKVEAVFKSERKRLLAM
jgi:SPP1 gp7 family putative phage head morphogenesis protein